MFSEFINENIVWVAVFVILLNLLIFSYIQDQVKGAKMVSALELPQLQRSDNSIIIDVSDEKEFTSSHIPDAQNFPLTSINAENNKLQKHKNSTVIVTCQTGAKSIKAAKAMIGLGFEDVHILRGGLLNWTKENLPVSSS